MVDIGDTLFRRNNFLNFLVREAYRHGQYRIDWNEVIKAIIDSGNNVIPELANMIISFLPRYNDEFPFVEIIITSEDLNIAFDCAKFKFIKYRMGVMNIENFIIAKQYVDDNIHILHEELCCMICNRSREDYDKFHKYVIVNEDYNEDAMKVLTYYIDTFQNDKACVPRYEYFHTLYYS